VILHSDGSTPQKVGTKAVIDASGMIWGTLGGGWVEAEARRRAIDVCQTGRPQVLDLHLDNAPDDEGPICGGSLRILLDPTAAKDRECYQLAVYSLQRRERGVLLTRVRSVGGAPPDAETTLHWWSAGESNVAGTRRVPSAEAETGTADGTRRVPATFQTASGYPGVDALRSCLERETPERFVDPSAAPLLVEVLIEPVIPAPHLVIAGGGHVGQALAAQAAQVGFDVTVVDDRPEFTSPDLFPPGTVVRCGPVAEQLASMPLMPDTYLAIVTRGHRHDAEALAACIRAPLAYLGMIGSRRKVFLMRQDFLERGLATEAEWGRVFAPIGLDIGAVTVPEIAASIVGQLIAVRRRKDARSCTRMPE
jgi:xanthine dehydrogenase accessory factor